jgi:hypothetical protein
MVQPGTTVPVANNPTDLSGALACRTGQQEATHAVFSEPTGVMQMCDPVGLRVRANCELPWEAS